MAYPDVTLDACGPGGVTQTTYEETEDDQVTKDFLQNRQRMLNVLFED